MNERLRLQPFEAVLVAFGLALFCVSLFLLLSDISLRRYLLGWQNELSLEKVGTLQKGAGDIRRKTALQGEFQALPGSSDLYNFDTIVTGPQGSATLELKDGSAIELGANTMIKLEFETRLALNGISRATTVNVVSGKVLGRKAKATPERKTQTIIIKPVSEKASPAPKVELSAENKPQVIQVAVPKPMLLYQAAEPDPSVALAPEIQPQAAPVEPIPVREEVTQNTAAEEAPPAIEETPEPPKTLSRLQVQSPKENAVFRVRDFSKKPELSIAFQWIKSPADIPVRLSVRKEGGQEMIGQLFSESKENEKFVTFFDQPGLYHWELKEASEINPKTLNGRFRIDKQFRGIQVRDPLVGGQKTRSNLYSGKHLRDFDITLSWEPYPSAVQYEVAIYREHSKKPITTATIKTNEYTINRKEVFSGTIFYAITGKLSSGFEVLSDRMAFRYDFLPPIPSFPKDAALLSAAELSKENNQILFTWVKTNYTDYYEFELAADPTFRKLLLRKKVQENFTTIESPGKGTFFWRVKSFAKGLASPPTPTSRFAIGP